MIEKNIEVGIDLDRRLVISVRHDEARYSITIPLEYAKQFAQTVTRTVEELASKPGTYIQSYPGKRGGNSGFATVEMLAWPVMALALLLTGLGWLSCRLWAKLKTWGPQKRSEAAILTVMLVTLALIAIVAVGNWQLYARVRHLETILESQAKPILPQTPSQGGRQ